MREATDGNGHFLMNITYSPDGRITSQTLKDGRIFRYEYLGSPTGRVVQIQFIDPQDFVTIFACVEQRYTQSLPFRRADGRAPTPEPLSK